MEGKKTLTSAQYIEQLKKENDALKAQMSMFYNKLNDKNDALVLKRMEFLLATANSTGAPVELKDKCWKAVDDMLFHEVTVEDHGE